MRIALIYDVAYPYSHGGGEKRNWEVARRLAARGHDVQILTTRLWEESGAIERGGVLHVGVCDRMAGMFRSGKRSFLEPLYFGLHVYRHLRRNQFDIVDCSNFPYLACIAAWYAVRKTSCKTVVTWFEVRGMKRWIDHRGPFKGIVAALFERLVARLPVKHVAISGFTRGRVRDILKLTDCEVVECGVDQSMTLPVSVTKNNTLLYVGRLAPYKRVDMLLNVFISLLNDIPDLKLKIVGNGLERERLTRIAEDAGVTGRVEFCGSLSENELREIYAQARVLILPSEQEGFGLVVLEAMSAGTPVIVRKAHDSAASDLVEDGKNGLLFSTTEELRESIMRICSDEALRTDLVAGGRATASRHSWDGAVLPGLEECYKRLLLPRTP